MQDDFFYYEDVVEVTENILSSSGSIIAKTGQQGIVKTKQYLKFQHIDVLLDGNSIWRSIPTWKLKMVKKNIEKREVDRRTNEKLKEEFKNYNVIVGQKVTTYPVGSQKSYDVIVTRIDEKCLGFHGYRIKKNGERYSGKLGEETYFTVHQLKQPGRKVYNSDYVVGNICLMYEMGWNIIVNVGEVIKVTSRTYHVKWDNNKKPTIYKIHTGICPCTKEEVSNKLMNYESNIQYNAYQKAKNKLEQLGFDVSNLPVVPDDYLKRKMSEFR